MHWSAGRRPDGGKRLCQLFEPFRGSAKLFRFSGKSFASRVVFPKREHNYAPVIKWEAGMIIAENESFDVRTVVAPPLARTELDLSRRGSCGRICALCPLRSETCPSGAVQPSAGPSS